MSEAELSRYQFAWTAPESGRLGSILLRSKPSERLSASMFWSALGARIDRMIAAENESDARYILSEAERNETALVLNDIAKAGSVLASESEWLRSKISFPIDGISADEMEHEPETLELLSSGEDLLEEFIGALYHDPDWY